MAARAGGGRAGLRRGRDHEWSRTYDEPGNTLIAAEGPLVRQILDRLPPGRALDAACGTGRHAEYLSGLGHQVIGLGSSPDMLARARARVPSACLALGDLHRVPLPRQRGGPRPGPAARSA